MVRRRARKTGWATCAAPRCTRPAVIVGLRGLCPECYVNPAVRESVVQPDATVVVRRKRRPAVRPLPTPTDIPPGPNSGKVAVLAARRAAGQQLWHQDDAKGEQRPAW